MRDNDPPSLDEFDPDPGPIARAPGRMHQLVGPAIDEFRRTGKSTQYPGIRKLVRGVCGRDGREVAAVYAVDGYWLWAAPHRIAPETLYRRVADPSRPSWYEYMDDNEAARYGHLPANASNKEREHEEQWLSDLGDVVASYRHPDPLQPGGRVDASCPKCRWTYAVGKDLMAEAAGESVYLKRRKPVIVTFHTDNGAAGDVLFPESWRE